MSLEALCRFDTMLQINHIVNCALTSDDRERSSGRCLTMQFTSFLEKLRKSFEATVRQERLCDDILVFDDFIRIADFSYAAIREIAAHPSTHIEKVDTKIHANRAAGFSSRTMRWMSQRPGRTIEEKISPENKILTRKTVFSADTKENREFMYLYRVLHEAITERIKYTSCQSCSLQDHCDYYEWVLKIKKLMALNLKIKASDLADVKPVKQSVQNNKLMCDKNYKIIWDAVQMLSHIEEKIEQDYKANLVTRLATILYWLILGKLNSVQGVVIADFAGALQDDGGRLWFGEQRNCPEVLTHDLLQTDDTGRVRRVLTLELKDSAITLRENGSQLFSFCTEEYFREMSFAAHDQYIRALLSSEGMAAGQSDSCG